MKIEADLSEVTEPLEPGEYKARVMDGQPKEWKSGTRYIAWKFEIFENESPELNGRNFTHNTPIEGGGAFKLDDLYLAATGEKLPKGKASLDTEQIIGKEFLVTLRKQIDKDGNATKFNEVHTLAALS